ncbi:hypothetical protein EDB83DRAFT_2313141 [Lactarius deliciosus]|nr:hypothetical protein EDB83DRAFT_2313141 [Lactarius deliciosus]
MPAPPVSSVTPSHITDFNAVPTPDSKPALTGNSRRRRALMTLLDVLGELTRDEDLGIGGRGQQPSFEDDGDVPSVDEHLQQVGAESFDLFQRRVNNLDKELRNFSNAARQLGSSVGIMSSAFHLRERLAQIAWLFRENAADLFPRKVSHQSTTESAVKPDVIPRRKRARSKAPPHVRRPLVLEKLDPEDFPHQLGLFARDVITFLHCLNEFPEFTDEALNASIVAFEGDLKYWASCLKVYEGEPLHTLYRAVLTLTQANSEIGEHIESITSSLSVFIEIGVPTIRFAQNHGATNLLNLSTVATFFSAVTATTLQYTFDSHSTPLEDAVNAFWFTSMVFSIAAAVNSLLGLTWKQAMYAGSSLDTTGKKWLQDSLDDWWDAITSIPPFHQFVEVPARPWTVVPHRCHAVPVPQATHAGSAVNSFFHRRSDETLHPSSSENSLPSAASPEGVVLNSPRTRYGSENSFTVSSSPIPPATVAKSTHGSTVSFALPSEKLSGTPSSPASSAPSRGRFAQTVRNVIRMQQAAIPYTARTYTPHVAHFDTQPVPMQSSRVAGLVPKLRGLEPTQDLAAHQALVRHLQFSPNGKFLATSRIPFTHHRTLAHPSGFVSQVAWSPSGKLVLTKLTRSIKVWTEAGVCSKTIDRYRPVQSICWLPGGEGKPPNFSLQVTSRIQQWSSVHDITGKVLDTYHFDRLMIHDVSVTQDGQRLLGVGTLLSSGDGLQPSRCRAEKRIISKYQYSTTFDTSRWRAVGISLWSAASSRWPYPQAPPQLWKLEMMKDRNNPGAPAASRLSLRHTYMPKSPVDFAGPSHFGGKDDQLVLCAGKAGDIHIWDRESGALLHHVRAQSLGGGDLTCVAWNPAADPFMFATGSHDGAVRVWTTQSTPHFHMRRISGSVTPLSDTSSQLQLDFEPRAESSTGQQRFENVLLRVETPVEFSEGPAAQSSEHTIVFSTPRAGGTYPTHL